MKLAASLLLSILSTIAFRKVVGLAWNRPSTFKRNSFARASLTFLTVTGEGRTGVRLNSSRRTGVDPSYYSGSKRENDIKRTMASKKKSLSELQAEGAEGAEEVSIETSEQGAASSPATKKAKTGEKKGKKSESPKAKKDASGDGKPKFQMKDYMPKSYPKEEYPPAPDGHWKIGSYNVNGLKACYEKGFVEYVTAESPDVLVLQETKLQEKLVSDWQPKMEDLGYAHQSWSCSVEMKGYAGTAVLSKIPPKRTIYGLLNEDTSGKDEGSHNEEGRTITTEFDNFFLVNCYVPNSGQKLERLKWREEVWDPAMLTHLKTLEGLGKPVIFTGDLNVAHTSIDLKNDKKNHNKVAGYCDEEIAGFQRYMDNGFIDAFRHLNPDTEAYSYYGMRFNSYQKGSGWRIDYFVCSEQMTSRIEGTHIRKAVYGASDHCPITLHLKK